MNVGKQKLFTRGADREQLGLDDLPTLDDDDRERTGAIVPLVRGFKVDGGEPSAPPGSGIDAGRNGRRSSLRTPWAIVLPNSRSCVREIQRHDDRKGPDATQVPRF